MCRICGTPEASICHHPLVEHNLLVTGLVPRYNLNPSGYIFVLGFSACMETLQLWSHMEHRAEGEALWGRRLMGLGRELVSRWASFLRPELSSPMHTMAVLTHGLHDQLVLGPTTNQVFVSLKGKKPVGSASLRCPLTVQSTMTGLILPPPPPRQAAGVLSTWWTCSWWIAMSPAQWNPLIAKPTVTGQTLPHPCSEKCFLNAPPTAGTTCQVPRAACRDSPSHTIPAVICSVHRLRWPFRQR